MGIVWTILNMYYVLTLQHFYLGENAFKEYNTQPGRRYKLSRGRQNNRYDSRKGAVPEEVQGGDRVS